MRLLLISSLLFGTAYAAQTLPSDALIQPNQTWVMSGQDFSGEDVQVTYKLSEKAPKWEEKNWEFTDKEVGKVFYEPEKKMLLIINVFEGVKKSSPFQFCMAFVEEKSINGVLFSGSIDEIQKSMSKVPRGNGADTYDKLMALMKESDIEYGTCTFKLQ